MFERFKPDLILIVLQSGLFSGLRIFNTGRITMSITKVILLSINFQEAGESAYCIENRSLLPESAY